MRGHGLAKMSANVPTSRLVQTPAHRLERPNLGQPVSGSRREAVILPVPAQLGEGRDLTEPLQRRPNPSATDAQRPPATSDRMCDENVTVRQLREIMREFVRERQWEKFHNAKNLSMSLAIETGELLEHFQWLTTDEVVAGTGLDRPGIADELADVLCYALSLANALDIDIAQAIEQKMVKNRRKYPA